MAISSNAVESFRYTEGRLVTLYDVYSRYDGDEGWTRCHSVIVGPRVPEEGALKDAMDAAQHLLWGDAPAEVKVERVTREWIWGLQAG